MFSMPTRLQSSSLSASAHLLSYRASCLLRLHTGRLVPQARDKLSVLGLHWYHHLAGRVVQLRVEETIGVQPDRDFALDHEEI